MTLSVSEGIILPFSHVPSVSSLGPSDILRSLMDGEDSKILEVLNVSDWRTRLAEGR